MNRAIFPRFAIVLALLQGFGCQAMMYGTQDDLSVVSLGMSKEEVTSALGPPARMGGDADKQEEYFYYQKMPAVIAWAPKTYTVTFRSGRVVRYGEQVK